MNAAAQKARNTVSLVAISALCILLANTGSVAAQESEDEAGSGGVAARVIEAYPAPAVTQLLPNEELLYDRRYQRVINAVDIFDSPGGNVTGQLAAGFNFLTTGPDENGWSRINDSQYVLTENLRATQPSRYAGVLIEDADALEYPFAWALVNIVPSRVPGEEPEEGTLAILRYTLLNLYDSLEIDGWRWYQVGLDQWVHQTEVAKFLPVERPADVETNRWVSVDLYEQVLIAYEDERPVFATLISSGLAEWPTNEGLFSVYVRYPRTIMSGAEGQSDFYYLEEVPWTQYFDDDIGLHGTYWHDGFGYRHSHGCVNMSITDSAWIYDFGYEEIDLTVPGDTGMDVYVYSSGQYR